MRVSALSSDPEPLLRESVMNKKRSGERRQEILETLAHLLETRQGKHITTAVLAAEVGVSEAALYRHFPGKSGMFEALIEFVEGAIFTRITRIQEEREQAAERIHDILMLVLGFAERNPGISRLLHGDVLTGETEPLQKRMAQLMARLETGLRNVLREARLGDELHESGGLAALLMAVIEGRIASYVRSGFRDKPLAHWDQHWPLLHRMIFG